MQTFNEFWEEVCKYNLETAHPKQNIKVTFSCANGCGAKGGINFPNSFLWLSIETACNNHDIDWKLAENYENLVKANHRFRRNMEKIIDIDSANWLMKRIRYHFMNRYYTEVKMLGTRTYAKQRGFGND